MPVVYIISPSYMNDLADSGGLRSNVRDLKFYFTLTQSSGRPSIPIFSGLPMNVI